jgi:hypothetical protein
MEDKIIRGIGVLAVICAIAGIIFITVGVYTGLSNTPKGLGELISVGISTMSLSLCGYMLLQMS